MRPEADAGHGCSVRQHAMVAWIDIDVDEAAHAGCGAKSVIATSGTSAIKAGPRPLGVLSKRLI